MATNARVRLPGPRVPTPIDLPHILTILDVGDGEREWEIEHHEECPQGCWWWPGAADEVTSMTFGPRPDHHLCYVAYELENWGIDTLDCEESEYIDPTIPRSGFGLEEWKRLKPGRYTIQGWYRPGGSMPWGVDDPEGGLILVGPAPPKGTP